MATKRLTYYIGLTSAAAVEEQQGIQHPRAWGRNASEPGIYYQAPDTAAANFSAPLKGTTETGGPGPYTHSPWFSPTMPGPAGAFPTNVASFTRGPGGFWGWVASLFGWGSTTYYWVGQFVHIPATSSLEGNTDDGDPIDPVTLEPIPPAVSTSAARRWIEGFEAHYDGGQVAAPVSWVSPEASRHPGGWGAALRSVAAGTFMRQNSVEVGGKNIGAPAATASDRERLYIRVRRRPSGGGGKFWYCDSSAGVQGCALEITPTGEVALYNMPGSGSFSLLGTSGTPLVVDTWYRLDMVYAYPSAPGSGVFLLYIGGELVINASVPTTSSGIGAVGTHSGSAIGSPTGAAPNGLELDVDDWICVTGPLDTADLDWRLGSAVLPVHPTGFGGGHGAWVGDWRELNQRPIPSAAGPEVGASLTSSTALARAEVLTDAAYMIDAIPGAVGITALMVSAYSTNASGVPPQIGYKIAGGADVLETAATGSGFIRTLYRPSGVLPVRPVAPLSLIFIKGNDGLAVTLSSLLAQAEVIGVFGPEDERIDVENSDPLGLHNWPYPRTPWTRRGVTLPIAPVALYHGVYTGNGTGQDVTFPTPIHWWWARRTDASPNAGTHWWSSLFGAHAGHGDIVKPMGLAFTYQNPTFVGGAVDTQQVQSVVQIAGTTAESNAAGVNYQFIAVTDPGMRFFLNTAFSHWDATAATNPLIKSAFLAAWAWLWTEDLGTAGVSHGVKGPGHAAATYQKLDGTTVANAITLNAGSLATQSAIHVANKNQVGVSLWRADDGSTDPGKGNVVSIFTYTGDGAASRTLAAPAGPTKAPLFALVQPANAAAHFRDPSHVGTASHNYTGASTATGITGGTIGGIKVGTTLNSSGIVYNVFILWGAAAGNADGWTAPVAAGTMETFIPVEPIEPVDQIDDVPISPELDPGVGDEEPDLTVESPELSDDLADCPVPTTKLANRALANIGHSTRIADMTVSTEESDAITLHFDDDVQTVLAAFPWPFATKYHDLELVSGTLLSPVNGDWTFAYRQPGDCVFERRIVVPRQGAVDPTPPPFQLGHDDDGPLIYTNQEDAVLEYTARVPCVAAHGDPIFLEALSWKLAASIAPALTRMPEKETTALERFAQLLARAEQVVRPGIPGAPPTADPDDPDVGAGCGQANTDAVNRALIRIGARTITSLATDQSREASTARAIFEAELRSTLRDFDWPFATAYADAMTLVDGATDDPTNLDWVYGYQLPDDVLKARRLVAEGYGRSGLETEPYEFRTIGSMLYTNEEDPVLEYTYRPDCALGVADDLFKDAFSWRLAFSLAPSLATINPETPEQMGRAPEPQGKERPATQANIRERAQRTAWAMYQLTLSIAKAAAANEQQRDPEGPDAPWHTGR